MVQFQLARRPNLMAPRGDMFDEMFRRLGRFAMSPSFDTEMVGWVPAIELREADGEFVVTAELPGVKASDVDVSVDNNILTVKGMKEQKKEKHEEQYYIAERQYGAFERCFTLPQLVDADRIHAAMKDGILVVKLPKAKEAVGQKIQVKEG